MRKHFKERFIKYDHGFGVAITKHLSIVVHFRPAWCISWWVDFTPLNYEILQIGPISLWRIPKWKRGT